jgi:diguanylate cyclase (GGDEF)-like protein/PAS domain S-box-containing protein
MAVHRLIEKQLKRTTREDGTVDIERLVTLVSAAYEESDKDRKRTDRSIEMMIEELNGYNHSLEDLVAKRTTDLERVHARLEVTLENADQGIVMIGADGRVITCNQKFIEYAGLAPESCKDNPSFGDLVRMMVENGEFDPMGEEFKRWALSNGSHLGTSSFQRTRPDGTVLQVRARRLPDGGEVRTMTDITDVVRNAAEVEAINGTLQATLLNVTQGILKIDADHRIAVFNPRVEELLGLEPGYLKPGMPFRDLLEHQIERGEFSNMPPDFVAFVRAGGVSNTAQCYLRYRPDGSILEIRTVPLADGSAVRTYTDITEQKQRELQLKQAESELRSLFDNAIVGIYRSTAEGKQLRANPALVRMNGFETEAEMIASIDYDENSWYVQEGRREEFIRLIERDGRVDDFVSEVYRYKTRERFWVSESAWLVRDENGQPLYFEGMVIDATARREAEREIAHIALHDMLTDLPNRALFLDTLTTELKRNRKGAEVAVLCLDLDHFKDVNDTMGHDAGDILLRMAAKRLLKVLPARCMAARFGGDEFAIIAPEIREREPVLELARNIVRALSHPFRIRGKRVYVGASVGIAMGPTDGDAPVDLMKKADIALYRAKHNGRGTYACFDPGMTAAIVARREVEVELRRAIEQKEFRVFYQPIVDLETAKPVGYEALIRWQHPTKGLLSPFHFIEIAEECGLISPIGEIVLEEACHTFARLDPNLEVSVNLSPVQFRNHQLAVSVVSALASSGLPPSRLVLEITESVLLNDDARTLDILRQLRTLGVRIALDDFGIGHSSLSYLQKFRFDKIKIDKSFVHGVDDGTMNTAIRRAILGLGHDLSVEVIVEGVETATQRDMLIYEGARYAQGYLWGKPRPIEEQEQRIPTINDRVLAFSKDVRAA